MKWYRRIFTKPMPSQKRIYNYYRAIIVTFAVKHSSTQLISYLLSIVFEQFSICIYGIAAGTVLSFIVINQIDEVVCSGVAVLESHIIVESCGVPAPRTYWIGKLKFGKLTLICLKISMQNYHGDFYEEDPIRCLQYVCQGSASSEDALLFHCERISFFTRYMESFWSDFP